MSHRRRGTDAARDLRDARRNDIEKEQRNRILLGAAVISVAIVLVAGLLVLAGGPPGAAGAPRVGERAPDFAIVDIDGRTFQLSARTGAPILLDFMGSRCSTCVAEMPELRSIFSEFSARGLVMISIDVGGSLGTEDPGIARGFMTEHGGPWPVALDNTGIGVRYGVVTLPTLYIIDPTGFVAYRHGGVASASTLSVVISQYI